MDNRNYEASGRPPTTLRQVPESWWDLILNGTQWYVCADTFEVPGVSLMDLRSYAYRRARARGLWVSSVISRRHNRLYLQAHDQPFYGRQSDWDATHPAPAMHLVAGDGPPDAVASDMIEAMAEVFRRHGYTVLPPSYAPVLQPPVPDTAPEPRPREKPFNIWDMPVPEGWTRSVYTNRLLPPGVPDIKGAIYDDDMSREDMMAAAVEFQEAAARCTCGTEDLRTHPPSCPVWG